MQVLAARPAYSMAARERTVERFSLEPWLDLAEEEPAFSDEALLGRLVTLELALRAVDASVDAA